MVDSIYKIWSCHCIITPIFYVKYWIWQYKYKNLYKNSNKKLLNWLCWTKIETFFYSFFFVHVSNNPFWSKEYQREPILDILALFSRPLKSNYGASERGTKQGCGSGLFCSDPDQNPKKIDTGPYLKKKGRIRIYSEHQ